MRSAVYLPQSATSVATTGQSKWNLPGDAITSDNAKAWSSVTYPGNRQTQQLKAMNPNPAEISDTDTVTQVTVNVERCANNSGGSPKDMRISLIVGGALQSENLANASAVWPTSDAVVSYVFTVSLSGAQVKAADFGVVVSAITSGAKYQNVVRVDSVSFEFDY